VTADGPLVSIEEAARQLGVTPNAIRIRLTHRKAHWEGKSPNRMVYLGELRRLRWRDRPDPEGRRRDQELRDREREAARIRRRNRHTAKCFTDAELRLLSWALYFSILSGRMADYDRPTARQLMARFVQVLPSGEGPPQGKDSTP
jgi:hypothetical protein